MTGRIPWSKIRREIVIDLRLMTVEFLVCVVLASDLVPRPLRFLGYRALGLRTASPNISPGLRVTGTRRNLSVDRGTFVNQKCFFEAVAEVRIGADCQIGPQVMILTSHHAREADGQISRTPDPLPVVIGDRVWIGGRALILPGVVIEDDVVIGAGAVVTRRCLAGGTYVGVPARAVGATQPADARDGATAP